jgi:MFS family permease
MPSKTDSYSALRYRDFRFYIGERFLFTMSVLMMEVIVQWQVYDLTHDKLALGLIGLSEAVPKLSISLYAGHIVDRFPRKRIAFLAMMSVFACMIGLVFISMYAHQLYALFGVWPYYLITALCGVGYGFSNPANFSLLAECVPTELYGRAAAWNSSTWQTAAIVGPALGGFLYWLFGATNVYLVSVTLTAFALIALYAIPTRPLKHEKKDEPILKSLKAGVSFVFKNQIILGALSLDLFAVLFGGATALLPVFASDILHVGAEGLGILRAAPSIGAVIMAVSIAKNDLGDHNGRKLFLAVAGFGICMILFALSTNFILSLLILVASGAFDSMSVVIRSTILQVKTPDAMRGRVSSVNAMFIGSSNEIGAFESGLAAKFMGTVPSVIFGGVMTIITVIATGALVPALRKMRRIANPEQKLDSQNEV